MPLTEIGVHRWQHDFWIKIIQAALDGTPDQVALDWHPALSRPAASRYSASTPALLKWLAKWNEGEPYRDQVRPFGFLLSYTARTGVFAPCDDGTLVDTVKAGRPRKRAEPKPIAPYDSDPISAVSKVFDRITGKSVEPTQLKTYAEVLCQYHLSSENKFENGQFLDRGRTERRHIVATEFVLIGKEANMVGESGAADPIVSAIEEFKTR